MRIPLVWRKALELNQRPFSPKCLANIRQNHSALPSSKIWCRPSVTIRIPSPLQGDALPFELGRHNLERHARFELAPSAWKAVMLTINTNIAHYSIVKEHKKKSLKFLPSGILVEIFANSRFLATTPLG